MPLSPAKDPLLQPYRLKRLTLRNRILSTAHEPARRAFPKAAEDWDLDRVVADYTDASGNVHAAIYDALRLCKDV